MAITLSDLIPEDCQLVEKETLAVSRGKKRSVEEKRTEGEERSVPGINPILDAPVESELELALSRVRYTQEEIDEARGRRRARLEQSNQAVRNAHARRIKSKTYRRHRRQEKQKSLALTAQIEAAVNAEEDSESGSGREGARENVRESAREGAADQESRAGVSASVPGPEVAALEDRAHTLLAKALNLTESQPVSLGVTYGGGSSAGVATTETAMTTTPTPMEAILDIEFAAEKAKRAEQDQPEEKEVIVPGWNAWGGSGIVPVSNATNTSKVTRSGIALRKRRDFQVSHVIYNERASQSRNPKYGVKKIPTCYQSEHEYQEVLGLSLDITEQPATILNQLLKGEKKRSALSHQ